MDTNELLSRPVVAVEHLTPRAIGAGTCTVTLDRADALGVGHSMRVLAKTGQPNVATAPVFARVGEAMVNAVMDQTSGLAAGPAVAAPRQDTLDACRALIEHLLERMAISKELTAEIGFGSRTRELLVNAAVAVWPEETRSDIGEDLAAIDGKHWPVGRANRRKA